MANAIKQYLDTAPLDQAIEMIEKGVISYAEVLVYCTHPLSEKSSDKYKGIPDWILGQTLGSTEKKHSTKARKGSTR